MAFYEWDEQLTQNVEIMDFQHRELLGEINLMFDAMIENKESEVLSKLFLDIITNTKVHFSDEEALMINYSYPDYREHKSIHDNLITQIEVLYNQFIEGKVVINLQFFNFLKDWLNNHILVVDFKAGRFINGITVE